MRGQLDLDMRCNNDDGWIAELIARRKVGKMFKFNYSIPANV